MAMETSHECTKSVEVDATSVAIAGDSAGGNLAAAVALKLRDEKLEIQPTIQCLLYPVLQSIDLHSPSRLQNSPMSGVLSGHGVMVSGYLGLPTKYAPIIHQNRHLSASLRQQYSKYLDYNQLPASFIPDGYEPTRAPPSSDPGQIPEAAQKLFVQSYVAPLLSPDLSGLPQAYVFTVGADTLRDDGALYVKRLQDAGVKAKLAHYPESFHGVLSVGIKFEARDKGRREFVDFIKKNL
ncbi:arylacetamide deacetylase-like [Liolophura sinensis]|uniref:arylacetamide deacetylase-like n=1 Tax=Liolophura sinensis TaxID=3198878 RepID=UPI003159343B